MYVLVCLVCEHVGVYVPYLWRLEDTSGIGLHLPPCLRQSLVFALCVPGWLASMFLRIRLSPPPVSPKECWDTAMHYYWSLLCVGSGELILGSRTCMTCLFSAGLSPCRVIILLFWLFREPATQLPNKSHTEAFLKYKCLALAWLVSSQFFLT